MFALGLLIGIYSYVIFILGLVGILSRESILVSSIIFILGSIYYFYRHKEDLPTLRLRNKNLRPLLILFGVLAFVNLIGALGPELSFDALWYHLTLPKVFLQAHTIIPITQGIFYYSLMPKLGEMLFTPAVAFNAEVFAKLTQWAFGILTSVVIYKISRRYLGEKQSFLAVLIFYGSLVVAWESSVAYIDLIRTFFEAMGLWGFLIWHKTRDRKILIESAVFIGLAISTKVLALGTLPIFWVLFFLYEKDRVSSFKNAAIFTVLAILSAFPWLLLSFLYTSNPIYPFFSSLYKTNFSLGIFNPVNIVLDMHALFFKLADPISPLYVIFLPLVFIYYRKLNKEAKLIAVYSVISIVVWYFIPRTGGGRFILPYLPAMSVLCMILINQITKENIKKYCYLLIILVFCSTIIYRGIANARYLPVITGRESKDEFLTKNLNFNFGDFYDTDGFFKNAVGKNENVLLYGFHNLYYADFNFIHESYVKPGDRFTYIATQNADLPQRFKNWQLIYTNDKTHVKVYTMKGIQWQY